METSTTIKKKERNGTIDIAKGIGIMLMVFAHVNYTQPYQNIIYGFHMPLFYIISGMLFVPEKYSDLGAFIKRKVQTILCPYVLFALITVLCQMCFNFISGYGTKELLLTATKDMLSFIYSRGSLYIAYNYPMWFVTCLFLAEVMFWFVSRLKSSAFWAATLAITVFGWYIQSDCCFTNAFSYLPWSFDSACFVVGFLAIGYKIRPILSLLAKKTGNKKWKTLCAAVLLMAAMIPLALLNGKVSIGSKILHNGILFYITGILGTLSIMALSWSISQSKLLQYCGKNSFYIMAIHVIILGLLIKGMQYVGIGGYDNYNLAKSLPPFAAVVVSSMFFSELYVRTKNRIKERSKCQ